MNITREIIKTALHQAMPSLEDTALNDATILLGSYVFTYMESFLLTEEEQQAVNKALTNRLLCSAEVQERIAVFLEKKIQALSFENQLRLRQLFMNELVAKGHELYVAYANNQGN
jgi:hypothetical protein